MGKEVKLGLALIAVLLIMLGGVVYYRISLYQNGPDGDEPQVSAAAAFPTAAEPRPAAVVNVAEATPDAGNSPVAHDWASARHHQEADVADAQPRPSFLPNDAELAKDPRYADAEEPSAADAGNSDGEAGVSTAPAEDSREAGFDGAGSNAPDAASPSQSRAGLAPAGGHEEPTPAPDFARLRRDNNVQPVEAVEPVESDNEVQLAAGRTSGGQTKPQPSRLVPGPDRYGNTGTASRYQDAAGSEAAQLAPDDFGPANPDLSGRGSHFGTQQPTAQVENGKYTVQPNDSLWIVSEKVYGNGGYFKAIFEHNRRKHPRPEKLQVGDVLEVPPASTLERDYPALCPKHKRPQPQSMAMQASARMPAGGKVYVVENGDTLFDIARFELGKASRWVEIYELNREHVGEDFDFLQPGTELVLPADRGESDSLTRERGSTLQR